MKALLLKEKNSIPSFSDVVTPFTGADETLVTLKAASLNRRDLWITKGLYPGIRYPIVLGSDGAGVCEGREVVIQPGVDWGDDERSQSSSYQILGLPKDGTFAESVVVNRNQIFPKPNHLSMEEAAALPLAGLTAYRVLMERCRAKSGEKLLVTGAGGGVALCCIQFAIKADLEVYVTSGSNEKIEKSLALGVVGGVNYKSSGWTEKLKERVGGFDLIIDGAGGADFSNLVKLSNPGGRIGIYGGTNGAVPNFSPQPIFWKQLSILGSTMGSPQDFANMLDFVNKHKIVPVVDSIFRLEDGAKAFERMNEGSQFGKIVLTME